MFFKSSNNKEIYADYASATPTSTQVLNKIHSFSNGGFYNPSALYAPALRVRQEINKAREVVAHYLQVSSKEIYFIDGATEANNLALQGIVSAFREKYPNKIPHIITSNIEHASILEPLFELEHQGVIELSLLNVDSFGRIATKELKQLINKETLLVTIAYANGEIGTIQEIRDCAKIIRQHRKKNQTNYPYFHTDAVQAINYIDVIKIPQLGVDSMTFNAAKIYGPKKIAVLFCKKDLEIKSQMRGGNQEFGMRSGTEDVFAIIGQAEALAETRNILAKESKRMDSIGKYAFELFSLLPDVIFNTPKLNAIPNIINISFPNISHEELLLRLDACKIYASVKSACKAGEDGDSHVILAIRGENKESLPTGSLRFSFGRATTKKEVHQIYKVLHALVMDMNGVYKKYYTR